MALVYCGVTSAGTNLRRLPRLSAPRGALLVGEAIHGVVSENGEGNLELGRERKAPGESREAVLTLKQGRGLKSFGWSVEMERKYE